jgi:hypothetical protein
MMATPGFVMGLKSSGKLGPSSRVLVLPWLGYGWLGSAFDGSQAIGPEAASAKPWLEPRLRTGFFQSLSMPFLCTIHYVQTIYDIQRLIGHKSGQ